MIVRKCSYRLATLTILALLPLNVFSSDNSDVANSKSSGLEKIEKVYSTVYKKAAPAVVFIKCESTASDMDEQGGYPYGNQFDFDDDFLRRFFGVPPRGQMPRQAPQISHGSGFFISQDGYIITNAHVVKNADKITVSFNDHQELEATLVGTDPRADIAVIKVEGKNFPSLTLGDSDVMEIGDIVLAIGTPFQLESTLTQGIISGKRRQNLGITDHDDFIQTDAAINPGNSGGPLLNLKAEVIGVNTAILSRSGGYMGIGLAIPSNMAKYVSKQIIEKGGVTYGFMGVSLQPVDKDIAEAFNLQKAEGALVTEIVKDSPADKAGLKQGDIILGYNGQPVTSIGTLRNDISLMQPGTTIKLQVFRKGQMLTIPVTIGNATDREATSSMALQKLGIEVDNLSPALSQQLGIAPGEEGVVIMKIRPGSPAASAGLRPGFLIKNINDKPIKNVNDFNESMQNLGSKSRIVIMIRQGMVNRYYSIKLD